VRVEPSRQPRPSRPCFPCATTSASSASTTTPSRACTWSSSWLTANLFCVPAFALSALLYLLFASSSRPPISNENQAHMPTHLAARVTVAMSSRGSSEGSAVEGCSERTCTAPTTRQRGAGTIV